jgi:hypothetical protein
VFGEPCSNHGKDEKCKILVGRPDEKMPIRRNRQKCEDNIIIELQCLRCEDINWINMARDRVAWKALVGSVTKFFSAVIDDLIKIQHRPEINLWD